MGIFGFGGLSSAFSVSLGQGFEFRVYAAALLGMMFES